MPPQLHRQEKLHRRGTSTHPKSRLLLSSFKFALISVFPPTKVLFSIVLSFRFGFASFLVRGTFYLKARLPWLILTSLFALPPKHFIAAFPGCFETALGAVGFTWTPCGLCRTALQGSQQPASSHHLPAPLRLNRQEGSRVPTPGEAEAAEGLSMASGPQNMQGWPGRRHEEAAAQEHSASCTTDHSLRVLLTECLPEFSSFPHAVCGHLKNSSGKGVGIYNCPKKQLRNLKMCKVT